MISFKIYNFFNSRVFKMLVIKYAYDLRQCLFVAAYSKQLELVLAERIQVLSEFKQKVSAFRAQLVAEEQISQKIKRPAPSRHN